MWVKFAKQVSSLSFPSCSTSNQIEKKQENYNFRLALSLGNISQKRKHKTRRRNSQHGTLATFMVEILSYQSTFQKATLSARKLYFPNVHLALTKIWQTGFFHSVSVDFFEVAPRLKLGFCGWSSSDIGAGKLLGSSIFSCSFVCSSVPHCNISISTI